MADKCVIFFSDNAAVVDIINKQMSKHQSIMVLIRDLVLRCLRHNVLFHAKHIPGFYNTRANYISRSQVAKFKELSPNVDENPTSILCGLLSSALTEGTRRSYQGTWAFFRQFYARFYGSPIPTLPLSSVCLPFYISYLSFHKLAYSMIALHLSATSYAHKVGGFCDLTKSFLIQKLFTALSRQRHSDIHLPITRPVLHELVQSLEYTNSSAFQCTLFSAMFLSAFYGLFRIGELSTKSSRFACSVVQYRDLQILSCENVPCTAKATITDYKHNSDHRAI